ncbi:MAG: antitoxin [Firmicutes bacterium]|nr:antitoxin [Bacillota bacterium]
MIFSIRLTEDEMHLADSYARFHSLSLSEAFKQALFERIEEEYDIVLANEAYDDYVKGGKKSRPIEELWEELEVQNRRLPHNLPHKR